MKIDRVTKGILSLLAQNCRLSNVAIGKALRVAKDTVRYRILELEKTKHLQQYVLFIDARKLGFFRYHLLIRFDAGYAGEKDLLKKLSTHPAVMWINTFVGRFDLQIIVDARSPFEFQKIRDELFQILKGKIIESSVLGHLYDLEFTQQNPLIRSRLTITESMDAAFHKEATCERFPVPSSFTPVAINKTDALILQALADDPRMSISAIAESVGSDRVTVRKKIKRLLDQNVILNFGGIPNIQLLGYVTYYFLVRLVPNVPEAILDTCFNQFSNIFYAGKMVGDYDLIIYLNARNPQELHDSMQLFRASLDKYIIATELLVQEKLYHWRQYTSHIHDTMQKQ